MHLNADQMQALESGQPVPMFVNDRECVLIRKDAFEQHRDDFTVDETYGAVETVLDQEEEPGLDSYQQYKR